MTEGTVGQIGRYKVVDELGRGGFGCVYLGFDASVDRQVAIKVLTEGGKELLARFRNEAQVAGKLRHENIVTVYEYGEHEGRPFLAMEYLEGEDLHHVISTHKPLTLLQKCSIMAQVADGLHCAHSHGVVHRDVKPANIMMRPDGRVKIMDFGIARLTQGPDSTRLTQEGWMIGTLLYTAPDQFAGAEVDALSDIFAYGVVFYELLTGHHPFESSDSRNLMYKISFAEPPSIRSYVPECPDALERIVLRLLAKDRELRYQSLEDARFDIEGVRIDLARQRAEELLHEAQDQVEKNDLDSALSLVAEALGLDPSNRAARGLRESLQKQLQHRALLPKIEALMNSAESQLGQRHFQDAVHTLENARKLDPESNTIQARLENARGLLEHSKAADALIAEARRELDQQNLTAAHRTVSEALQHDPQNSLAGELLDKIQHEIERRQREQRIEEALQRAEGLIRADSYDEAIDFLAGLGRDAESPKVERLLSSLRGKRAERERERAIGKLAGESRDLAAAQRFEDARRILEKGLKAFPGEQALLRQLENVKAAASEWEREQAIVRTNAEAGRLAGEGRFDEALNLLSRVGISSPALAESRSRIEQARDAKMRRDAVEKGAAEAAALLQNRQPDAAVKVLEELAARYPGEPLLESGLDLARQASAERRAAEERRNTVEETIRECGRLARQGRFDEASERCASALQRYPDDPSLLRLPERLKRVREEQERTQAIARDASKAASLLDSGRLEEAITFLGQACGTYPGEESLGSLLARAEKELAARKELERAKAEGNSLIGQQQYEEAIQAMERALASFPGNAELDALLGRAREAMEARRREDAIAALVKDARAMAGDRDFEHALLIVERGLNSWPGDQRLLDLRSSIHSDQKQFQRDQTRTQIVDELQRLTREQKFTEARKRADEALKTYAGDADLLRVRNECEMREILARAAAAQGRPQDGLRMLQDSAERFGTHPDWKAQLERLRQDVAAMEQKAAIGKTAEDAVRLANSASFEEALKLLDAGALRWPGEGILETARRSVMDLKKVHDRKIAIQTAATECVQLAEQGRLPEAIEQAAKALNVFPGDATLTQLRKRFDEERQVEERRRRRQQDLDELRGMDAPVARAEGSGKLAEFRSAAERIVSQYPGDEEIRSAAAQPLRHLSDIERAGNAVRERNFAAALEICRQYLTLYPEHVCFRALEADAERGRRAGELEEISRSVERETDLGSRAATLEKAFGQYPDDAWIANELRLTRNKLELVQSMVSQAKAHEAAGAWDLAIEQWTKLASVYEKFPGLAREIERVRAAGERAKTDAIARWIGQIEPLVNAAQFGKARELLMRAIADLPDAAQLRELLRKLDELREKHQRIHDLLGALRKSRERGNWQEFDQQAAEALRWSADDAGLRKTVLEKLMEHARSLADPDWSRAEGLITLVQSADLSYPIPSELLKAIAKGRRTTAIDAALRRASELRNANDMPGALAGLEEALREYPDDSRLQSTRRSIEEQWQKDRAAVREELRQIQSAAERAAQSVDLDPLSARVASIASAVQADADLAAVAAQTGQAIAFRRKQLDRARLAGVLGRYRKQIVIAAGAAVVLIAGTLGIRPLLKSSRDISVTVTSDIAGASVSVAGSQCVTPQCVLKLPPGNYTLTAGKDGFRPISLPLSVSGGQTDLRVPLVFEPLPEVLQINTNFESGSVVLDGRPAGALRDSQFSISGLAPGQHSIRVTGGDAEFSAEWQSAAGARPELIGAVSAKNVQAAVIANAGANGAIACNCDAGPVMVDGSSAGQTKPGSSAALTQLHEGQREISVGGRSMVVDIRPNPAVNVFLALNREVGVLVVNAGQDDARIYINDRLYARRTEHGVLRIPVPVGEYSVRVEKDNYRSPGAQTAVVAKGEEKQIRFALSPAAAVLEIAGAQPHAQLKIDGQAAGETDANGHLRTEVSVGAHAVELTKDGYTPARWETRFDAGAQIRPNQTQIAMAKLPPVTTTENKPVDTEAQDWSRVANSSRIEELQDYVRKHPSGAHEREAQSRIDQLRQAETARKEQADWDAVDRNNKAALQDYLTRHSGSPHAQDARTLLDAIQKRESAASAAAAERERQEKLAEQEKAGKAADAQAIVQVLAEFETAYNNKDPQAMARVYSPLPAGLSSELKQYKSVSFQIRATEQPQVNGDSATVTCTRSLSVVAGGGHYSQPNERVRVSLVKAGSRWTIREISKF
ncbi:MAG TPA: protein kinase [Bryobacteraceae bacterium]|nr:protein kinase [Bryobacteraceae bacterium]